MNENRTIKPEASVYLENNKPMALFSLQEKLILPAALLIAILFDRLLIGSLFGNTNTFRIHFVTFWLVYLIIFHIYYHSRIVKDAVLWIVSGSVLALIIWHYVTPMNHNEYFSIISALIIPLVLMAQAQWASLDFSLTKSDGIVAAYFMGWCIKPFSGIITLFRIISDLFVRRNSLYVKKVLIGIFISAILLAGIIPLLLNADMMFNHYATGFFSGLNFGYIILHGFIITVTFALFYSFLWNIGFGHTSIIKFPRALRIDKIIMTVALSGVIIVYVLFCLVLFTYLFAQHGLPYGMTYSEYARQGFAQTVAVCAINLILFGAVMRQSDDDKLRKVLLGILLGLTGIMLFSGGVRLNLYIQVFGMTWLRLLSAWFITYIGFVIAYSGVKLFFKRDLPFLPVLAVVLLVWFVALGVLNPDRFIEWFNVVRNHTF